MVVNAPALIALLLIISLILSTFYRKCYREENTVYIAFVSSGGAGSSI